MSKKRLNFLNHSGFTLIELVIAVSIMAITLALAGPALGQYTKTQHVKNVAREIYTNLQMARMTAIKNNINIVVTFAADDNDNIASMSFSDSTIPGINFSADYSTLTINSGGDFTFTGTGTSSIGIGSPIAITVQHNDNDITTTYNVIVGISGGVRFQRNANG